jgi:hypothetical protein
MPNIVVNMCSNFSAKPGDSVTWENVPPSGCTFTHDGTQPWPFNVNPPIKLPPPANVGIRTGLAPAVYCFKATCCPKPICVTVT